MNGGTILISVGNSFRAQPGCYASVARGAIMSARRRRGRVVAPSVSEPSHRPAQGRSGQVLHAAQKPRRSEDRGVRLRRAQHHGDCQPAPTPTSTRPRASIRQVGLPVPATNLFLPGDAQGDRAGRSIATQQMALRQEGVRPARAARHSDRRLRQRRRAPVPDGFPKDRGVPAARRLRPPDRAGSPERTASRSPSSRCAARKPTSSTRRRRGSDLVNAIDDPNFQLMIDFYHLASEQEDPRHHRCARAPHPPPAHGQPDRPRVSAQVGRVRLRAVLRGAPELATTSASAWKRLDAGSSRLTHRWQSRCCVERFSSQC